MEIHKRTGRDIFSRTPKLDCFNIRKPRSHVSGWWFGHFKQLSVGGHDLARQLDHVLSRTVWLDNYNVSDSPEGAKGGDLASFRDKLVTVITLDGRNYPIWMQRVPRGDGEKMWKISHRSVELIPELYDKFSYP